MKTERKSEVDLLRVIAMLFVIAIQTLMLAAQTAEVGVLLLTALLFASNGAFFMISGRFNLDKRFHSAGDILKFYFKRLLTIVFPLLVTTTLMYVTDVLLHDRKVSLGWLYASFMGSYANTHLWFVYVLIGLIFSTPILAKAVQNMDHGELHILFALGLVWAAAKLFLAEVLGLHFPFSGWILGGHAFLFFLGYYLHTTMNPKMKKWIYLAGIAGFVATVFFSYRAPDLIQDMYGSAFPYILYTMAFYTFITEDVSIHRESVKRVITFLGKHSFTVYLIHWTVLYEAVPFAVGNLENPALDFFVRFTLTFLLSLCGAVAVDNLLFFPIQKKLMGLVERENAALPRRQYAKANQQARK